MTGYRNDQRLEFTALVMKLVMRVLSSFAISRNWLPNSYWSPTGIFLIQAILDMAFIGLAEFGTDISTTRRQASEINWFVLKQTPPSLRFLATVPVGASWLFFRFLYCTGMLTFTRGNLLFSKTFTAWLSTIFFFLRSVM